MVVYYVVLASTLYMLGFFIPLLIQLCSEKGYCRNKKKFINFIKNYRLIRFLIVFFKKKDINKSLSLSCMVMGILSLILSNITMLLFSYDTHNQLMSLFLGLWAPTLIVISLYLKK